MQIEIKKVTGSLWNSSLSGRKPMNVVNGTSSAELHTTNNNSSIQSQVKTTNLTPSDWWHLLTLVALNVTRQNKRWWTTIFFWC